MFDVQKANMEAANVLSAAKAEIMQIFDHPDAAMQQLSITSTIDRLTTRLHTIGGTEPAIGSVVKVQFEPVTMFMGEPVDFSKKNLSASDAEPSMDETEKYKKAVEDLYLSIPAMPSERIVKDYKGNANMELQLRGAAKKANVFNFADGTITVAFVDAIKEGIMQNDANDELREQENANLLKSLSTQPKETQIHITAQHLSAFPHLVAHGVEEGMVIPASMLNVDPLKVPPSPATPPVQPLTIPVDTSVKHEAERPAMPLIDSNITEVHTNDNGEVTDITVTTGGTGYVSNTAQAAGITTDKDGNVTSATINNPGPTVKAAKKNNQ